MNCMAGELSWLEHRTHKPGVGGSNPPPATIINYIVFILSYLFFLIKFSILFLIFKKNRLGLRIIRIMYE